MGHKYGWILSSFCFGFFSAGLLMNAFAQDSSVNYDESKVPPYTLPDPLMGQDGRRITSTRRWVEQQRPAMLKLFAENVYGRMPGKPKNMHFSVFSVDSFALRGQAIRKQITIFFDNNGSPPSMDLLLYLPKSAKTPGPIFTGLNFYGNQTINANAGIRMSTRWTMN